jgi:zinc protease
MKTLALASVFFVLVVSTGPGLAAAPGPQLPAFTRVVLTNGLVLLLMEQHEVPLISLKVVVRAGSVDDSPGKEGLALRTAELLRHGTTRRTADQVAAELDFIGATLDIGGDPDRVWISSEFMAKDSAAALDLLSDLLQHPIFPAREVKKLLKQELDGIKAEKEEARAVLTRYFAGALFGDHPYARPVGGDERSLAAIQRKDVTAFYQQHYGPETTLIAVVGDFVSSDLARACAGKLGGWKSRGRPGTSAPPEPTPVKERKLLLVDKPDTTQSYFAIGNVGIARNHPDRTGIELVNLLFGGRFTSMLNEALRINSGLTYGAHSWFQRYRAPGPFIISSFTPNASTVKAMDLALEVLEQLHRQGLSEAQLQSAKDYFKGQFPPHMETADQLANLLADLEFYGLDPREINELFLRVDAFTPAEARRIIHQYFPRENLVFTLIGKAGEIETSIKKYAPHIQKREIEQPGFK